ncbi:MFS transporter [Tessaracoccus flavus]|uniref:Uncharacterized protein n=1 Tax=Tessaracoccus flavus TaxID=1610493 RepID=A0A1Q2CF95_9ACTN|nr:MFS transporter [Tessaracoccus flavus]AQP44786.1 hypothetical protein RPIT_08230 [Tessaracoccus flavus]SDZ19594.1 Predicted arabinose efflux permease, MFS family [Tessaracoccus flavus]
MKSRAVLRSLVGPVYAPTLAQSMGMMATMPVIPLIALSLGFSVPAAAALTMISGVVGVLGPIPLGLAMTIVGERRAMIATGSVVTLTQTGAFLIARDGVADGPTLGHQLGFVATLLVSSVAREVWVIGRQAYLGAALPPELRARGMSTFGGMMRIGQVLGPLLGAGIIALGGEAWVLALDAAAMAVATVLVAVWMVPGEARKNRRQVPGGLARLPVEHSPHDPRRTAGVTMIMVGLAIVPLVMARVGRPLIVPLLGAMLGLAGDEISLIFAVAAVVEIAMFVPAGSLMDRYGRTAVIVPCLFFSGAGYGLLVLLTATLAGGSRSGALIALTASAALIAFGNGFGAGALMTLGIDLSPEANRTRHLARWNTITGSGRLLTPALVSLVTLAWPITAAGAVIGALCWAGALWAVHLLPQVTPTPPHGVFSDGFRTDRGGRWRRSGR